MVFSMPSPRRFPWPRSMVGHHNKKSERGLAEFERHLILTRTSEGRQRAQARGVQFGRKRKLTLHQQQEALARRARGEAVVDIARSYAGSHSNISRLGAVFTT
jgi:DNA invertase Pin-like site-specific DNA recombinase